MINSINGCLEELCLQVGTAVEDIFMPLCSRQSRYAAFFLRLNPAGLLLPLM